MPVLLAQTVDIECSHQEVGDRRLMSIGSCLFEVDMAPKRKGTVLRNFFMVIDWGPDGLDFDAPTRSFWDELPSRIKLANTQQGSPPNEVAKAFSDFLEECQRQSTQRKAAYKIVTDNAGFDIGWLDWFLSSFNPGGTLLQKSKVMGPMHNYIVDVRQRVATLFELNMGFTWEYFKPSVAADHTPINDAINMAQKYQYYKRFVCSRRFKLTGCMGR